MTHKLQTKTKKIITSSFMIAGMVLMFAAHKQSMYAQQIQHLTGGGAHSLVLNADYMKPAAPEFTLQMPTQLHGAAPVAEISTATATIVKLSLGMLLVLIGFLLHALLVIKEDRSVHITAIPQKSNATTKKLKNAVQTHYLEMYWIEMGRERD